MVGKLMVSTMVQKVRKNGVKIDGLCMLQKMMGPLGKMDGFKKMINALGKLDAFKSGPQTHEN